MGLEWKEGTVFLCAGRVIGSLSPFSPGADDFNFSGTLVTLGAPAEWTWGWAGIVLRPLGKGMVFGEAGATDFSNSGVIGKETPVGIVSPWLLIG